MEQTQQPILVRALLTDEEWKALRKAAIDDGKGTAEFIGVILRAFLAERGRGGQH